MVFRSLIAVVSLVFVAGWSLQGCSTNAQKIEPETRGKRGETCLARNDCASGLACINNICAKNEFNISVTAKECTRIECTKLSDCCGSKETNAPAKCEGRDEICDPTNQFIQGCTATSCTSDTFCNGGTCMPGSCQGTYQSSLDKCETAADCPLNTCVIVGAATYGTCSLSGQTCDNSTLPCTNYPASCASRTCDCRNPAFDQTDPICTDEACTDICLLRCEDSLCVEDHSCKTDNECLALGLQICDGGRCVECTDNTECDEDADETCNDGFCKKPCKYNEECPLLYECNAKGDCEYSGCHDDRECILAASRGAVVDGEGQAAVQGGADDPRLYQCLASDSDPDHKTCKIPCENDGSCGQFQVCDGGYCKFVGCDTDEQCRNYLGIANQQTSDTKPFVAQAKCVDPLKAASAK